SRSSSTTATLRASRSQRDSVGCGTPSSPLSALADTRPAPTMSDTACALNFSPYCLLTVFFQTAPELSYLTSTESEEATTTLRQGAVRRMLRTIQQRARSLELTGELDATLRGGRAPGAATTRGHHYSKPRIQPLKFEGIRAA